MTLIIKELSTKVFYKDKKNAHLNIHFSHRNTFFGVLSCVPINHKNPFTDNQSVLKNKMTFVFSILIFNIELTCHSKIKIVTLQCKWTKNIHKFECYFLTGRNSNNFKVFKFFCCCIQLNLKYYWSICKKTWISFVFRKSCDGTILFPSVPVREYTLY